MGLTLNILQTLLLRDKTYEIRILYKNGNVKAFHINKERYTYITDTINNIPNTITRGIYFTINPIKPQLLNEYRCVNKEDIEERRLILVDCDSVHPKDQSATEEEKKKAWDLKEGVKTCLGAFGWKCFIEVDSGNGYHILLPVDMLNTEASTKQVETFLKELKKRLEPSFPGAILDATTYDSPRISKLPGTYSTKGKSTEERPWREAKLLTDHTYTQEDCEAGTKLLTRILEVWDLENKGSKRDDYTPKEVSKIERAIQYLKKMDPAVQGKNGSATTFRASMVLVEGFSIDSWTDFKQCIEEWNQTCKPPWTDKELKHKYDDAIKKRSFSRIGHLLKPVNNQSPKTETAQQADKKEETPATVADLEEECSKLKWIWPLWFMQGAIHIVASDPKVGKTRFILDLIRRIQKGYSWPSGQPMEISPDDNFLLMLADGNHQEIFQTCQSFGIKRSKLYLSSSKEDIFGYRNLETVADWKHIYEWINFIKPRFFIIDTLTYATSKNLNLAEEAVHFINPLQELAKKTETAIICLCHTNRLGEALGRRLQGAARVIIKLEHVDKGNEDDSLYCEVHTNNKRRLYVQLTNFQRPDYFFEIELANSEISYNIIKPKVKKVKAEKNVDFKIEENGNGQANHVERSSSTK